MPALTPIDPARLALLADGTRWQRIDVVAQSGSTNAELGARVAAGEQGPAVLAAEHQSAGRGRLDRVWTAPAGANIALSVVFAPHRPLPDWTWLPLVAGVAVARAIRRCAPELADAVVLKWPNDVLLEGEHPGKVCGILAETHLTAAGPVAVLGMGINVGLDASELPVDTASSLLLSGATVDKTELAGALLVELDALVDRWERTGELRADYVRECSSLSRGLRVVLSADESVTGTGVDIDEQGRLVVLSEGRRRAFAAGDIVHLRRDR